MIAGTLQGIVSQRLVPTADGKGRVACCEILVMTGRVHDMILDPKLTGQLPEVIAEGAYYGMQTFDQHLLQHLQAGRITMDEALRVATSPHDFKLMVAAQANPTAEASPAPAPQGARPPAAVRRAVGAARVARAAARAGPVGRRWPQPAPAPPAPPRRPAAPPPGRGALRAAAALGAAPRRPELLALLEAGARAPALTFSAAAAKVARMQTTLAQFNETQSAGRVRAPELEAAEGARSTQVTIQAKLGSMVAYQGDVTLRARRLRRPRADAQEGDDGRGHAADEDHRQRRGVPGRPGAGRPPDLPRERLHHGQRPEPARVRLGHRLGHQARRGRQRR